MKLIFATGNQHKLEEARHMLPDSIELISLKDLYYTRIIPEPFNTLNENARMKSETLQKEFGGHVFSEDSGLFIHALDGAPGVHSARYAGPKADDRENLNLVLDHMKGQVNREAFFKTVISLWWEDKHYFFEGKCEGIICTKPQGVEGFGYDPIFVPHGYQHSFAELGAEIKNRISHRKKAMDQLSAFLSTFC